MLTVPGLRSKVCVLSTVTLVALAPRLLHGQASAPRDTTPDAVVRAFIQPFNARDPAAVLSFVSREIA